MLAQAFQFGEAAPGDARPILAAPQASIMKALVEGFMSQQPVAYTLFGAGAMIAVLIEMLGVPTLVFALGMYLPLELNLPALVGGALAHYLGKTIGPARRRRPARGSANAAVIIASGFMAGGALGGVIGAALRLFPWYREDLVKTPFFDYDPVSQTLSALGLRRRCACICGGTLEQGRGNRREARGTGRGARAVGRRAFGHGAEAWSPKPGPSLARSRAGARNG